jgi:hypothetical protein
MTLPGTAIFSTEPSTAPARMIVSDASDSEVWQFCHQRGLLLLTAIFNVGVGGLPGEIGKLNR